MAGGPGLLAEAPTPGLDVGEPGPDLAERLAARGARFRRRHPRVVAMTEWLLRAWLVVAVPLIIAAFVIVPSFGNGFRVLIGVLWLLAQLVVFCRSRTLQLRTVLRLYSLGAALAVPIGLVEVGLRNMAGWTAFDNQPSVFLAGPVEEVGKLAPLALFAAVAWNRVRRMSAADFLLAGAAAGAGFQLVEDSIRRIATRPGLLDALDPNQGRAVYGLTLFPGWRNDGQHEFAGHAVLTGLVAAGVGIAAMHRGRRGWRWLIPLLLLCWVVLEHAGFNDASAAYGPGRLPGWIRSLYEALGSGSADRYLLLVLLLVVAVVDYRAMWVVEADALPLPRTPTPRPPARVAGEFGLFGRAVQAGPGALVLAWRVVRAQRELAIGIYRANHGPARLSRLRSGTYRRSAQLAAVLASAGALSFLVYVVFFGPDAAGHGAMFIAGLLDAIRRWWDGLSWFDKLMVISTILGLFTGGLFLEDIALLGMRAFTRWIFRFGLESRLGRTGYAVARYLSRFLDRSIDLPMPRLQHSFKHAADFDGKLAGNWNKAKGELFAKVLERHIRSPNTLVISGTYRGEKVIHYLDPRTGLDVVKDRNGELLAAWKLGKSQIDGVLRWGRLW